MRKNTQALGAQVIAHSVHVTDAMRYFLGTEVERVYAEVGTLFHEELTVDDCGLIQLTLRNAIIASVDPSWSIPAANSFHSQIMD